MGERAAGGGHEAQTPAARRCLRVHCGAILSDTMYLLISFRKSTPPQNRQLIVYFYVSSGRVFMINPRPQWKLLHIWIISVIVKHICRTDGPTEYLS